MIPAGVTLDLTGVRLTALSPTYLQIFGVLIIDDGGSIDNQSVEIQNYGIINVTDGSAIYIGALGGLGNLRNIYIDDSSFIVSSGWITSERLEGAKIYNDGAIFNNCAFTMDSEIVGNPVIEACGIFTGTIADATNRATGQSMYAGGRTFYGEQFSPDSAIISKVVDCATVELRRHGAPTGMAEIGFYDSNMNLVRQFGAVDVSTLTTGYKAYEFCLPSSENGHLITSDQILAVKYNGGDPINRIDVRRSNVGAGRDFDGLASYHVNYDTIWHRYDSSTNGRDLLFKLTL